MDLFTSQDLILIPLFLAGISYAAFFIASRYIPESFDRGMFFTALIYKLVAASAFCAVYAFYYGGGDTINYFRGSVSLVNLARENPTAMWSIMGNDLSFENFMSFTSTTGWPPFYMWRDANTFSVIRFSFPFCMIAWKSFLCTTFLVAFYNFIGPWKLYTLFKSYFPGIRLQLAVCILFIPSLIFWGSGIMKDSFTLSATCWLTVNFHRIMLEKKKIPINLLFMTLNLFLIINLKPYVLLSLFPVLLVWVNNAYIKQIPNKILRAVFFPIFSILIAATGYITFSTFGSILGEYGDVDKAIKKAQIIQADLLREEQYGSNSYNIGTIDGTITGMLRLAPMAIFTAIFRPLPNEIGSPIMVLSVIENCILLVFTFLTLLRYRLRQIIRTILDNPLITFSLGFSLFFAFGVGLASTNFGALVRYKAPLVPFFYSAIFMIRHLNKQRIEEQNEAAKEAAKNAPREIGLAI
ncbi:MAG: hypothetical protein KDD36_02190 [Flavobacteriales bacterium]|nr:hypothetical protein [Flavobacteriales bacterium]